MNAVAAARPAIEPPTMATDGEVRAMDGGALALDGSRFVFEESSRLVTSTPENV